jgi:hypothetical protein
LLSKMILFDCLYPSSISWLGFCNLIARKDQIYLSSYLQNYESLPNFFSLISNSRLLLLHYVYLFKYIALLKFYQIHARLLH